MTTLRDKVLALANGWTWAGADKPRDCLLALSVARLVAEHCAGVCDVAQHRDEEIAANQDNAYGERCAAKAFRAASIAAAIRKEAEKLK